MSWVVAGLIIWGIVSVPLGIVIGKMLAGPFEYCNHRGYDGGYCHQRPGHKGHCGPFR